MRFRRGGEDLLELLKKEAEGKIDALDVKIMFHQSKHNLFTIAPKVSLVQNIGHDGSGIHCRASKKFDVKLDLSESELRMDKNIKPDKIIINRLYVFRSGGIIGKIKRFLKRIGLEPLANSILSLKNCVKKK